MNLASPPATPRAQRRQREIIGVLAGRALGAYAAFGAAMAFLVRHAIAAFEHGSIIAGAFTVGGLIGIYTLTGGALCVAFVAQLRNWPPPGPRCDLRGGHFVRTWLWSAPRILVQLGLYGNVARAR